MLARAQLEPAPGPVEHRRGTHGHDHPQPAAGAVAGGGHEARAAGAEHHRRCGGTGRRGQLGEPASARRPGERFAQRPPQLQGERQLARVGPVIGGRQVVLAQPASQRGRRVQDLLAPPLAVEVEVRVEKRLDEGELAGRGRAQAGLGVDRSQRLTGKPRVTGEKRSSPTSGGLASELAVASQR